METESTICPYLEHNFFTELQNFGRPLDKKRMRRRGKIPNLLNYGKIVYIFRDPQELRVPVNIFPQSYKTLEKPVNIH